MVGNPYSSNEPDLGPLMRDVKNKICTDCELVALLEDDNGMELLVNNKIISLDLPVKDVYQKVWVPDAQEGEPMRVIYRSAHQLYVYFLCDISKNVIDLPGAQTLEGFFNWHGEFNPYSYIVSLTTTEKQGNHLVLLCWVRGHFQL